MDWGRDYNEESWLESPDIHRENNIATYNSGYEGINQMPDQATNKRELVILYDNHGEEVANGVKQVLEAGDSLNGLVLRPTEEAILIKKVTQPTEEVHELNLYTMAQCLDKVIRWPRILLKELTIVVEPEDPILQPSPSMFFQDQVQNFSTPPVMSACASMREFLGSNQQKRSYVHRTRPHRRPPGPRLIGMSRVERASMPVVLADKEIVLCSKRCLQDVDAKEITILRCMALKRSSYGERSTWLIDTLRGFMIHQTTMRSTRKQIKCVTRIKGKRVCNACFALAIGYSRSGLARLIREIRKNDRHTSIHGNRHRRREHNNVTMARALFEQYIKDFGEPQPHRESRRLSDNTMLQTICLPMNVRKGEIWLTINSKLDRLGEPRIGLPTFHKMWRREFTHVHIPMTSRFSKCRICWEYKNFRQSVTDEEVRDATLNEYRVHIDMTMEERMEYSRGRIAAITQPDEYLSIIIDGMDQNTTWVPKFRQSVKGIESRYLKTHLCGILVHGIGLYCHVWIDAHHKHDSNQVVTSLMKVLQDVRRRRTKLPPHLRIQADNCGRENKNVYILALCATLVALGIFREVQLSFLLVGHTHEDIDQRFSTISSALKRQDINSLKELLNIIQEKPTRTEPFVVAEHLEHIRDWKSFITPYLRTDEFIGTSQPQHFRFYMDGNIPRVQFKMYARTPRWEPDIGYACLDAVPLARLPIGLATVTGPEPRDIKVLEDYIDLKERHIARHQDVERNIEAVIQTEWLISYLKEFPSRDRKSVMQEPFWPMEDILEDEQNNQIASPTNVVVENILAQLPPVMVRGYFGPKSTRPRGHRIRQQIASQNRTSNGFKGDRLDQRNMPDNGLGTTQESGIGRASTSTSTTPTMFTANPFPTFDPHKDVTVGMFVAIETGEDDQSKGVPFFIAKVISMERQAADDGTFTVLWYEPRMHRGQTDNVGEFHKRYFHCINRQWIPSREPNDNVPVDTIITAWKNTTGASNLTSVFGIRTEKYIGIPMSQKYHLRQHLEYINWPLEEAN